MSFSSPKEFGKWLIIAGVVGFIAAIIQSFTVYAGLDRGCVVAVSFFLAMIGIAFNFPSLLEESPGQVSTMRVCVYMIVMVFAVVYIKLGWIAGGFEDFKIDQTWVYIIGLALGSKVAQKFGEDGDTTADNADDSKKGT
jgi:hypothetical protein